MMWQWREWGERQWREKQEIILNEGETAWKSSLNLHHPHFIGPKNKQTNKHNITSCTT